MTTEATAPTMLDVARLNAIGEWIAQAHATERVLACLYLTAAYESAKETLDGIAQAHEKDEAFQASVKPMMDILLERLLRVIYDIEDGKHINATSCPTYHLFMIPIGEVGRVFGLPPNEAQMATGDGMPRPWSADPLP